MADSNSISCPVCGKSFVPKINNGKLTKYCCGDCRYKRRSRPKVPCPVCGDLFMPKAVVDGNRAFTKTCSKSCGAKFRDGRKLHVPCKVCGKEFIPNRYSTRPKQQETCSVTCRGIWTRQPLETRFWSYVDRRDGDSCWIWTGSTGPTGYGHFSVIGKHKAAHRFSWEIAFGEIPDGQHVLHHCDNRPCVNPSHLFLGDHKANMEDCAAKGRRARGEQVHFTKVTEAQVIELKQLLLHRGTKSIREIAESINFPHKAAQSIYAGKTWKHVYISE